MDTNLKTSKKIRLLFYRLFLVLSCFFMLSVAWTGKDALLQLQQHGPGILTGRIYYLPEFRTYISKLYQYGMVGYIGGADENGQPIKGLSKFTVMEEAQELFYEEVSKGESDILYIIQRNKFGDYTLSFGDMEYPSYSETEFRFLLPEDLTLCCHWDGSLKFFSFFEDDRYNSSLSPEQYFSYQYQIDPTDIKKINFIIAIKNTEQFTSDYFQYLEQLATDYCHILWSFFISIVVFFLLLILNLCYLKPIRKIIFRLKNIYA